MSKILDWNSIAKVNFDENRREQHGTKTGKQVFQEAQEREERQKLLKSQEPLLKSRLLDHMVNQKPIVVGPGFRYLDEVMEGGSFMIKAQPLKSGTTLIYKGRNKTLSQWMFETSNGEEIGIYDSPVISTGGLTSQPNPGFSGLLYNTNISNLED